MQVLTLSRKVERANRENAIGAKRTFSIVTQFPQNQALTRIDPGGTKCLDVTSALIPPIGTILTAARKAVEAACFGRWVTSEPALPSQVARPYR